MNSKVYLVLDTASNRLLCPECIGLTFELPPTDAEFEEVVEADSETIKQEKQ